jgi:predicted nucleic acid-binding protein
VTDVVLDASVVLKWFRAEGEPNVEAARALRAAFEAGTLIVYVPSLLKLEILNVAGRRWRWDEARLTDLVEALDEVGFQYSDPKMADVTAWVARGLTAYEASYVALAEHEGIYLVTDDAQVTAAAPEFAIPLADSATDMAGADQP